MTLEEVRALLTAKIEGSGKTISALAWQAGIDPSHIHHVLAGRHRPGPKVLKLLGLRRVFSYERG